MARRTVLCFFLLVGFLVGVAMEPDSGTAASLGRPDVTGSTVGANHAKPLPRITTVDQVARATVLPFVVALVLALLVQAGTLLRTVGDIGTGRSLLWARVPARRGPPALAVG